MKGKSTMYDLMRKSELQDDDGFDLCDLKEEVGEDFKRKYKEFYSDIKTDVKEDW